MNTKALSLNLWLVLIFSSVALAGRAEFDYTRALPEKKQPVPISLRRNPFQAGAEPERPLPVLRDRDDPAQKLPVILEPHIRSVLRQPKSLLLLDRTVFQPGDEIRLGSSSPLEKFRVVLKKIEDDRLIFRLTSLDVERPGQVDCAVMLGPQMRKN